MASEIRAARGRDVELVVHPAVATPELLAAYGDWGYDWTAEMASVLSPEVGAAIRDAGFEASNFSSNA